MFVDTHCHIHESSYPLNADEVLLRARQAGVEKLICVGTSEQSSKEAIAFATKHENVFASVGVHPHDTKEGWKELSDIVRFGMSRSHLPNTFHPTPTLKLSPERERSQDRSVGEMLDTGQTTATLEVSSDPAVASTDNLQPKPEMASGPNSGLERSLSVEGRDEEANTKRERGEYVNSKLVAIGEIGLDYFYTHSPREVQIEALQAQIELALKYNLPIIFHVREAFDDFWPVFDNFSGIRGELHSFTDNQKNLEEGLKRGLFIGVNGISTFTKDEAQKMLFETIPLGRLLLETDAPFLTPDPLRGKVNEPAFVSSIAEHHARIRGVSLHEVAAATTANANVLFAFH